jgi:3-methyladenine DNA glycosylase AlkD
MAKMEFPDVMNELEAMGTDQNIKVYKRHGANGPLFGVSMADLKKLKKKIKKDQKLALQLWDTKNIDAQSLATMIVDHQQLTGDLLDQWTAGIDYYMLVDLFASNVVAPSRFMQSKGEQWIRSEDEWIGRAGWQSMALLAMRDQSLDDQYFESLIEHIQSSIHQAKNRTREAMNNALIAIGGRNRHLKKKTLDAAKTIGKVEVDHGQTSCKTPDAAAYITKIWLRKKG